MKVVPTYAKKNLIDHDARLRNDDMPDLRHRTLELHVRLQLVERHGASGTSRARRGKKLEPAARSRDLSTTRSN